MEIIFTSWPVCISIVLIIFLIIFYKPLASLIGRTKSITKEGLETITSEEKQVKEQIPINSIADVEKAKTEDTEIKQDVMLQAAFEKFPFLIQLEKEGRSSLEKYNLPVDKESFLIKLLTLMQASNICEILYREIFGSQILILATLNSESEGVHIDRFRPFYEQYTKGDETNEKAYPFENYLAWLVIKGLVNYYSDTKFFKMTDKGRYFLNHIINNGYPIAKPN